MPLESWTHSTKKPDVSSAGVLQTNYTRLWDLDPLKSEAPEDEHLPSFVILDRCAGATSSSYVGTTLQSPVYCHLSSAQTARRDWLSQQEEIFRYVFVSALGAWEGVRQLFDNPTADHSSVLIAPLPDLPQDVRKHLFDLYSPQENENRLYERADAVSEWVADASEPEQTALAALLLDLPPRGACVLVSAFADTEVLLTSETLLRTIANWVYSEEKRLAQAAAACLLECGGVLGETLLQYSLKNFAAIPHARLVQGIMDLLGQKQPDSEL